MLNQAGGKSSGNQSIWYANIEFRDRYTCRIMVGKSNLTAQTPIGHKLLGSRYTLGEQVATCLPRALGEQVATCLPRALGEHSVSR
jgi:hypothetical protein